MAHDPRYYWVQLGADAPTHTIILNLSPPNKVSIVDFHLEPATTPAATELVRVTVDNFAENHSLNLGDGTFTSTRANAFLPLYETKTTLNDTAHSSIFLGQRYTHAVQQWKMTMVLASTASTEFTGWVQLLVE